MTEGLMRYARSDDAPVPQWIYANLTQAIAMRRVGRSGCEIELTDIPRITPSVRAAPMPLT